MSVWFQGTCINDVVTRTDRPVRGVDGGETGHVVQVTLGLLTQDREGTYWSYQYWGSTPLPPNADEVARRVAADSADEVLTQALTDEPIFRQERIVALGSTTISAVLARGIQAHDGARKLRQRPGEA